MQIMGGKDRRSLWHHRAAPATQAPAAQAHHSPGHYNLWRARGVPTACSGTSAQTHEPRGLIWSCSHHCSLPSKETELLAETRPRLLTQLSCHLHQPLVLQPSTSSSSQDTTATPAVPAHSSSTRLPQRSPLQQEQCSWSPRQGKE